MFPSQINKYTFLLFLNDPAVSEMKSPQKAWQLRKMFTFWDNEMPFMMFVSNGSPCEKEVHKSIF